MMAKNLQLRAEAKANLKLELRINVVWNTCDKDLGDEVKSACEIISKSSVEKFQKLLPFREIFCKIFRESSI